MSGKASAYPRSNVLVLGANSVYTLVPSTLIAQVDALLDRHRLEEAVDLADRQLRKLQGRVTVGPEEADELRYVYQRIGFQCLAETRFDDAGRHFFAGHLDPRVLIRLYPSLCGSLFDEDETIDVFSGVAEHMPPEDSIDDIIRTNLVRNYSPHLAPNTATAPAAVELRAVLALAAHDMLRAFLRKWRAARREAAAPHARANQAVDTVLARLYAESGETAELRALVEGPNDVVLGELEPTLVRGARFDALCRLYRAHGQDARLLDVWSKLVTGEWADGDVRDPLSSMFALLAEKRDRALAQRWGVWLLKHDQDRAMKLLLTVGLGKRSAKGSTADESALLRRIQEADPGAGTQFLENLVLNRRNADPDWHDQLAHAYVDQLLACLADEATSKLWRAKAAAFASSPTDAPYVAYFAATTPDSDAKRTRLRTLLFLQGSALYAPARVLPRLAAPVLAPERAVLLGKMGRHREALATLALELHDGAAAEAYCTLGGAVVSPRTAHALGERLALQPWAALVGPAPARTPAAAVALEREKTVDEGVKRALTRTLLEVYTRGGDAARTARLLDAQGVNLDVHEVLGTLPAEWPLRVLSALLARSLRRALHARHEGLLVKAVAAGENAAVAERAWGVLRAEGAVVEEAAEDDGGGGEGLAEKVGLALELDEKAGAGDGGALDLT